MHVSRVLGGLLSNLINGLRTTCVCTRMRRSGVNVRCHPQSLSFFFFLRQSLSLNMKHHRCGQTVAREPHAPSFLLLLTGGTTDMGWCCARFVEVNSGGLNLGLHAFTESTFPTITSSPASQTISIFPSQTTRARTNRKMAFLPFFKKRLYF